MTVKRSWLSRPRTWLALVTMLLVAGYALVRSRGPSVKTAVVSARDLEQHIVASGRVWVASRVQVSTQSGGLVLEVAVEAGDRVRAGDLLVQFDDSQARAAVEQAKASVAQANARVEQLRRVGAIVASETLRQARTELENAERELTRSEQLAGAGVVTPAELDEARRARDVARAQATAAEAQQIAAAPHGADSRVALTALLQARAQLEAESVRLAQCRVAALNDGVVLSRSVEPGDVVQPASTLLVLAVDAETELVINPDERNLPLISLDQPARASADAYPDQTFDAAVSYIAPSIDPQRGSIEVRLSVPQPPPFLKPDMTVSVDLTVAKKSGALTLPSGAVQSATSSEPWVWAIEDGRAVRRPVRVGIRGDGSIEVASGLTEGEAVLLPERRTLSEGQRVRMERN